MSLYAWNLFVQTRKMVEMSDMEIVRSRSPMTQVLWRKVISAMNDRHLVA